MGARVVEVLVALAAASAVLGIAALPFMTPAWMHFEQDRSGAAALAGYSPDDLHRATDAILHDLFLGGDFGVVLPGSGPVLDAAERAHMRDVQGAFAEFGLLVLAALAVLVGAGRRMRHGDSRLRLWAAIRRGTRSLAVLLVVLGVIAIVAFDAAFEVFHELLFPGGNFNFDPRTEKLVQLFPVQFWSETALAFGLVAIVLALAVAWLAGRRAATHADGAIAGTASGASARLTGRAAR